MEYVPVLDKCKVVALIDPDGSDSSPISNAEDLFAAFFFSQEVVSRAQAQAPSKQLRSRNSKAVRMSLPKQQGDEVALRSYPDVPLVFLGIIHVTATAQLREKLEPSRFPPFLRRSLPADGLDPGDYCQVGLVLNPFYEPVRDGGRKWQPRPANEVVQLVDMSLLVDFDLEKIEAGMLRGIARERSRNLRDWDWFLATDPETKYAQPHPQVPIPPRPCRSPTAPLPREPLIVSVAPPSWVCVRGDSCQSPGSPCVLLTSCGLFPQPQPPCQTASS